MSVGWWGPSLQTRAAIREKTAARNEIRYSLCVVAWTSLEERQSPERLLHSASHRVHMPGPTRDRPAYRQETTPFPRGRDRTDIREHAGTAVWAKAVERIRRKSQPVVGRLRCGDDGAKWPQPWHRSRLPNAPRPEPGSSNRASRRTMRQRHRARGDPVRCAFRKLMTRLNSKCPHNKTQAPAPNRPAPLLPRPEFLETPV